MNTADRNQSARQYISQKLDYVAALDESIFTALTKYKIHSNTLNALIDTKTMGFRGVVATALTGKYLDPTYNPLNNFYGCNPRSIFEKGIYYAFENRIPCGKSDPLNVAKNINVLDNEWANGKRPHSAAQAAVDFLRAVESSVPEQQRLLIDFFFFKLSKYAERLTSLHVEISEDIEWTNQKFASALCSLTIRFPESGTIPQQVIAVLMNKVYERSKISVAGGKESVFSTNTTSKKPADIWLEESGNPISLFEITVKIIDQKRLDDCIGSVKVLGLIDRPIHFICRIPMNVATLDGANTGSIVHKGKTINFLDISSFIHSLSSLLTQNQIAEVLEELRDFVRRVERPEATKIGWQEIFG